MGLATIGQVLSHLQRENRLVVHVLIDGQEPDLTQMPSVRRLPVCDHTLFIETADPRQLVDGVLSEVLVQLAEADRFRGEACDLMLSNQNQKAMEKLSGCFAIWQSAQESVLQTGRLLRLDLDAVMVDGVSLMKMLLQFAQQLRDIKTALENRDFVGLGDILNYEAPQSSKRWHEAITTLRGLVASLQ
ncbi:MAG: hypothetical protein QM813_05785 [Verrucomicrobiota bacterium]